MLTNGDDKNGEQEKGCLWREMKETKKNQKEMNPRKSEELDNENAKM